MSVFMIAAVLVPAVLALIAAGVVVKRNWHVEASVLVVGCPGLVC